VYPLMELTPGVLLRAALSRFYRLIGPIYLASARISVGSGIRIWGLPLFTKYAGSTIRIGNRVVICSDSRFTALGVDRRSIFRTLRPGARIGIGDNVGMSGIVNMCGKGGLDRPQLPVRRKRNRCGYGLSPRSSPGEKRVYGVESDWHRSGLCRTQCFCWRAYSVILKGVTIGENSVIGAGSVVVGDIPANCIAAGNPCRVIRPMSGESGGRIQ